MEDPRGGLIVTHTYVPLYNNNNYEEQLQAAEQTEPLDLSLALAAAAEEKPALPLVQPSTSPPVVDLTISPAPGTKVRVLSPTSSVCSSASKSSILRFVITEKAPTRAFSWLKAATSAFTFKTLLRHYAKRALTPQSLNVKLGPRHNYHKGRAAIRHYANQPARPL